MTVCVGSGTTCRVEGDTTQHAVCPTCGQVVTPVIRGSFMVSRVHDAPEPPPTCGAVTVFWPDRECCDAVCNLPEGHVPANIHEDQYLGEWNEDEL